MTLRGWTEADRGVRLPAGRKADLAAYVSEVGEVTVTALAARFGVSPDTIRRDLDQLDTDGLLIRTHGGPSARPRCPGPTQGSTCGSGGRSRPRTRSAPWPPSWFRTGRR